MIDFMSPSNARAIELSAWQSIGANAFRKVILSGFTNLSFARPIRVA